MLLKILAPKSNLKAELDKNRLNEVAKLPLSK